MSRVCCGNVFNRQVAVMDEAHQPAHTPLSKERPEVAHVVPPIDGVRDVNQYMEHHCELGLGEVSLHFAQSLNHSFLDLVDDLTVFRIVGRSC